MKRFVFFFFAVCLMASLWLGSALPGVQKGAGNIVDALFPVRYDVVMGEGSAPIESVAVRFAGDTAYLESGEAIPVSGAEFVCLEPAVLKANTIRTGFASLLLGSLMLGLLLFVTAFTTMLCIAYMRRRRRAVMIARRRAARQRAAVIRHMPRETYRIGDAHRQAA